MGHRMVNGQRVECTAQEDTAFQAEWTDGTPGTGSKWLADQAAEVTKQKTNAKEVFADSNATSDYHARWGRGVVLVTMDELNELRKWSRDLKAAVAGAATLAALKTAVAALPTLNAREANQIMPAIRVKIDAE